MRCLQRLLWKPVLLSSFCVVLLLLFSNAVHAQTKTVTGKIINADNKEPLIGATVKVKGTNQVISTNVDGTFSLEVPSKATLEISAVGYSTQQVKADVAGAMTISMVLNENQLGEVVVIGYGTAKKSTLTGSVSSVDSKVFQDKGMVPNPLAALQGQVPGVVVTRSSAAPGQEGWNFQIR
ncbi:MAG TPA: carboxypeptidase-like regulatory domain-containing protein, partial [Niastella sp.]